MHVHADYRLLQHGGFVGRMCWHRIGRARCHAFLQSQPAAPRAQFRTRLDLSLPSEPEVMEIYHAVNDARLGAILTRSGAVTDALSTGPTREDAANRMFISLDGPTKEWALARYTLHPVAAMTAPVRLDHFWQQDWNASVIWCPSVNPPVGQMV
jgi:hypothetical protein